MEGMFRNMSAWVDEGVTPPRAPIIESGLEKPKLDTFGNALGGVRMPEITVPIGSYSTGTKECRLTGWMVPFMQEQLRQMYGTREIYLRRYAEAAESLAAARFILRETAARMKTQAATQIPAF